MRPAATIGRTTRCELLILLVFALLANLASSYEIATLANTSLCSSTKSIIKLGSHSKSGFVVSLGGLAYNKKHDQDHSNYFFCKFRVETSVGSDGIFAVIQTMNFYKDDSDNCSDWVQYMTGDGKYSGKFCGTLNAATSGSFLLYTTEDTTRSRETTPTINSLVDRSGRLDVFVHIEKEHLKREGDIDLKIVFTAFNYCYPPSKDYKPCNIKHKQSCIYRNFFNDGYFNCPYVDCVDEDGCSERPEVHIEKKSVGNKVIIGGVSMLMVIFVLFVCFVWMCRKYKKLCWADEFSVPPQATTSDRNSRTIEMNEPPVRTYMPRPPVGTNIMASGTAHGNATLEDDKDLPPSYESLFPQR